jgi:hypothetical protein
LLGYCQRKSVHVNGKVVGLVLLVAGGLMQAIVTAGAWIACGSMQQSVPDIPGWHENWIGIVFMIVGTLMLIVCSPDNSKSKSAD